jgi:DNA-binding beta-propeller fold protein YncE
VSPQLVGPTDLELVFVRTLGAYGNGPGQFAFPRGVAVDPVGRIFVADTGNHRVQRFDAAGVFLNEFGGLGFEPGRFHGPRDLAIGETLDLLVLDGENQRVVRYDLDGNLVGVLLDLGPEGLGRDFGWVSLGGLGTAPWGTVFLSDVEAGRLVAYEPLSGAVRQVGGYGDQPGLFRRPGGLSVNQQGHLLVADAGNGRVQALDARGLFVRAWPLEEPETAGHVAVAWLAEGRIVVAEESASRLTVLGADGRTLAVRSNAGEKEGALRSPSAVAVDFHQRIYVADTDNHRISVFRVAERSKE